MEYSKYTLCPRHLDLAIISHFCFTPFFPFLAGGGGSCTMHRMELPRPGTEPAAPAVGAQGLNHQAAREAHTFFFLKEIKRQQLLEPSGCLPVTLSAPNPEVVC